MKTINGQEDLNELLAAVQTAAKEIWLLPASALVNLLSRFSKGEMTAEEMTGLADALEMNEAVIYEQSHKEHIADVLFILSNPEINGAITPLSVTTLICRLA
jgi:hypothetical protein